MRAFLLAGGRGERLRPLTDHMPKCLVPINGQPLLGIWLDLLARHGITDVLLNLSHHVSQVRTHLAGRQRGPSVTVIEESAPLGSATTVSRNRAFVAGEKDFWILYADNLTDIEMPLMLEAHRQHGAPMTMGLFRAPDPRAAGIVTCEADGRIVRFAEKPQVPESDTANAGIYLARPSLLEYLSDEAGQDFGRDVFPQLVGQMYGFTIEQTVMDVGTPRSLDAACRAWAARQTASAGA